MKIAATIVTHNRLGLLRQCLEAIRNQSRSPDAIVVINNASSDGTLEWLNSQPDIISVTQANVGSAGGQHTAMKVAITRGCEWVWCMDDDGLPEPDCLSLLCQVAETRQLMYVAPNLCGYDGLSHFETIFSRVKPDVIPFRGGPFNGILVSGELIRDVGLPNVEFFIWGDENEWTDRIKNRGYEMCTCRVAKFRHPDTKADFRTCKRVTLMVRNAIWCARVLDPVLDRRTEYVGTCIYALIKVFYGIIVARRPLALVDFWRGLYQGMFTPKEHILRGRAWDRLDAIDATK